MGNYSVVSDIGGLIIGLFKQQMVPDIIANPDAIGQSCRWRFIPMRMPMEASLLRLKENYWTYTRRYKEMGLCVCGGAMLSCSFGVAPSVLNVLPQSKVVSLMPVATIMDHKAMMNIMPFGMCSSMANPQVAAATAAALGALTPMPCIPATFSPWAPGSLTVLIGNYPALNNTCKLICSWGGIIQITNPGNTSIQVK